LVFDMTVMRGKKGKEEQQQLRDDEEVRRLEWLHLAGEGKKTSTIMGSVEVKDQQFEKRGLAYIKSKTKRSAGKVLSPTGGY